MKVLFWHSNCVGKYYFCILNPILTFELSRKMIYWYSKSYFDIRTQSENRDLIFKILFWHSNYSILFFKILLWHSNWVRKSYFDTQNPISIFELSRKMLYLYSKSYFDIRTESVKSILILKVLFWHSNWVGKYYFCILNPILTFELSRKMIYWYSKSYFDIRTQSENRDLIFKILFWHSNYSILFFKILLWHSNWVRKSYFDTQNPISIFELSRKMLYLYSKSYFDIRTVSENRIQNPILNFELSRKIVFWHSKSYFDIRTEFCRKILCWNSNSYFDIRTESENAILTLKVILWNSNCVGKYYFHIQNPIWTYELSRKFLF